MVNTFRIFSPSTYNLIYRGMAPINLRMITTHHHKFPENLSMGCSTPKHYCPLCPKEPMNSEDFLKKMLYDDPHAKALSTRGIEAIDAMTGSLEIMAEVTKLMLKRDKPVDRASFFDDILLAISDAIEEA